jgi:hydroxyethylthiazole kinase-like uncharacterized protein yjeF
MTKILSAAQIRELDAHTIKNEPILSIDLMERACRAFVNWLFAHITGFKKVGIVCGTGNNGGDGLGIARMLIERGYPVKVWIVKGGVSESEDFKANRQRLGDKADLHEITSETDQSLFTGIDVLIDAVFGSGLSRPAEGLYTQVIRSINKSEALKIAVDVPSGLMADKPSAGEIVEADFTVTFQSPKLAFLLPQSFRYTGEWTAIDIGLKKDFIRESDTPYHLILCKDAAAILKQRSKFDHKGTFGHALLVVGSFGKMGAAVLSSRAALRAGLGLLTVHVPACGCEIMQTSVPEAMALVDENENKFSKIGDLGKYSTIGVGPGLGQEKETVKALEELMAKFRKPMVFDADALNILSSNRQLMTQVPEGSILTPHPKEFERLTGSWQNDFERLEKLQTLSRDLKSVVVLKGAYSAVALPTGEVHFNSSGNPGMATGGTGDVLTGILTGLLAQNYSAPQAAIMGVFLHGSAGDDAAIDKGTQALIASDLIDYLPSAYKKLNRK